jgi:predicted transcriptional regulator
MRTKLKHNVNITLDPDTIEKLHVLSTAAESNRSAIIRKAVASMWDKHQQDQELAHA